MGVLLVALGNANDRNCVASCPRHFPTTGRGSVKARSLVASVERGIALAPTAQRTTSPPRTRHQDSSSFGFKIQALQQLHVHVYSVHHFFSPVWRIPRRLPRSEELCVHGRCFRYYRRYPFIQPRPNHSYLANSGRQNHERVDRVEPTDECVTVCR